MKKTFSDVLDRSRKIDFEYMKTRMFDLEQNNILLEERLKKAEETIQTLWRAVQLLSVKEEAPLPEDMDVSDSPPPMFVGSTKAEEE